MASISNTTNRNVIPNWRGFKDTVRRGEVMTPNNRIVSSGDWFPIEQYIQAWKEFPSIAMAGDLLSAAIMNKSEERLEVQNAAHYVLDRKDDVPPSLLRGAQFVLDIRPNKEHTQEPYSLEKRLNLLLTQREQVISQIQLLKKYVRVYPYNPVAYVELALRYVELGNETRAKEMIEIALRLAPSQRYVCRSAARFYTHINDAERAQYILSHANGFIKDPWLVASELAVTSSLGRTSKYIKNARSLLANTDIHPFNLCELGSALGTLEFANGSRKAARKALATSIRKPNDNTIAQIEWLSRKYDEKDLHQMDNDDKHLLSEANSIKGFYAGDYVDSLSNAVDWLGDMPFSKRAIYFASSLAYTYLKDYKTANTILSFGLCVNPGDTIMLNNYAYSLALDNQTDVAEVELQLLYHELKKNGDESSRVCYYATSGLVAFRKGNLDDGHMLYAQAISLAEQMKKPYLAGLALLNLIREDMAYNPNFDSSILSYLDDIHCDDKEEEAQLKSDIMETWEKRKLR